MATPKLSLQEISNALKLAKSTTFRLVKTLENLGYRVRLEDQRYCLSLAFVRLGGLAQNTLDVCQIARPVMANLAMTAGESVTLFTVEGQEFICVDVFTTPAAVLRLCSNCCALPDAKCQQGWAQALRTAFPKRTRRLSDNSDSCRNQLHRTGDPLWKQ